MESTMSIHGYLTSRDTSAEQLQRLRGYLALKQLAATSVPGPAPPAEPAAQKQSS